MHGVCFQDVEKVAYQSLPNPKILEPSDAIVQVTMAGLCGSDLHVFHGRESGMDVGTVMGHEFVGIVTDTGSDVTAFSVGDRVFAPFTTNCGLCFYCRAGLTCRCEVGQLFGWRQKESGLHGGQSEFVRVPHANGTLMKVPDSVSDKNAILLGDNLSTGFFCAELADVTPAGVHAVIGCGTVGLLAIHAAKFLGAKTIVAVDMVEHRRKMAEDLGAIGTHPDQAIEMIRQATQGRGADAVMELVGLPAAQQLAYQMLRPGGIMSVIGCHCTPNFAFTPVDAYDKNLTYRTGRCPARAYMDRLTPLVADGKIDVENFITHEFAFNECERAYDIFSNRKDGCLKAVFVA